MDGLALLIKDTGVQRKLRYQLLHLKLKHWLLSTKLSSDAEIAQRITEYTVKYPNTTKILADAGVNAQALAHEFTPYVH